MSEGARAVIIDGRRFRVTPEVDGVWTRVESERGESVSLRAWTLAEHLEALERASAGSSDGVARFDDGCFAAEVLRRAGRGPTSSEFEGVALWWALGGSGLDEDGEPGAGPWALRPWSWREQVAATERAGGSLAAYLHAMLHASAGARVPEPSALAGRAALRLLEAVVAINSNNQRDDEMMGDEARAEQTLWLCATLGWTPGQVWRTPAIEVERLLHLRGDRRDAARSLVDARPTGSALARHPDAVVIEVEGP